RARQFRANFRVRVGQGKDDRVRRHAADHVRRQHVRARYTDEHIGVLQRIGQRALVGVHRKRRLVLGQVIATAVDHTLAIQHQDVVLAHAQFDHQLDRGDTGGAGTDAHDDDVLDFLLLQGQRIEQAGAADNGGAVLVVMEYRDITLLLENAFDLEAFRRLDVFQVDAAKGDVDAGDRINEGLRALRLDFDIEHVDTGEALEQNTLAFHHRLGRQRPQVAQAQDGGAITDHGHQVA